MNPIVNQNVAGGSDFELLMEYQNTRIDLAEVSRILITEWDPANRKALFLSQIELVTQLDAYIAELEKRDIEYEPYFTAKEEIKAWVQRCMSREQTLSELTSDSRHEYAIAIWESVLDALALSDNPGIEFRYVRENECEDD